MHTSKCARAVWERAHPPESDTQPTTHNGPKDTGSQTLNHPQNKPEAVRWGNEGICHAGEPVTGLENEGRGRTLRPHHAHDTGGGEAGWGRDEGPPLAALRWVPGSAAEGPWSFPKGHLQWPLNEDASGVPESAPRSPVLRVWMALGTDAIASRGLAETHDYLPVPTQSEKGALLPPLWGPWVGGDASVLVAAWQEQSQEVRKTPRSQLQMSRVALSVPLSSELLHTAATVWGQGKKYCWNMRERFLKVQPWSAFWRKERKTAVYFPVLGFEVKEHQGSGKAAWRFSRPLPPRDPREIRTSPLPKSATISLGMSIQLFNSLSKATAVFKSNDMVAFFKCQPWNHCFKKKRKKLVRLCVCKSNTILSFLKVLYLVGEGLPMAASKSPWRSLIWHPIVGYFAPMFQVLKLRCRYKLLHDTTPRPRPRKWAH